MKATKKKRPLQQDLLPSYIQFVARVLDRISTFLSVRFAALLFFKPYRFPLHKREKHMDLKTRQWTAQLPKSGKEIVIYEYGEGPKILLVHGWSGRGTQMAVLAQGLVNKAYSVISFDAPGHGKAPGSKSMMLDFIEGIHYLEASEGPFYAAVGHSLGGMSLLRAVREGFDVQRLVLIGTGNSIKGILRHFAKNLGISSTTASKLEKYIEAQLSQDMESYSGAVSAEFVKAPTLVIHDRDDKDVLVEDAHAISEALENKELYLTSGLGHRKILGARPVIDKILAFVAV